MMQEVYSNDYLKQSWCIVGKGDRCWSCDQQRQYIDPVTIGLFSSTEALSSTKKKLMIS